MGKKVEPIGSPLKSGRGFGMVEFTDRNGVECTLQCSSAIDFEDRGGAGLYHPGSSMVYLGPNDANPRILAADAARLGIPTDAQVGWIDYPVPDEVLMTTRMHLSRPQVRALIKRLNIWLKTGELHTEGEYVDKEEQA